jgi:hypothetical protein
MVVNCPAINTGIAGEWEWAFICLNGPGPGLAGVPGFVRMAAFRPASTRVPIVRRR